MEEEKKLVQKGVKDVNVDTVLARLRSAVGIQEVTDILFDNPHAAMKILPRLSLPNVVGIISKEEALLPLLPPVLLRRVTYLNPQNFDGIHANSSRRRLISERLTNEEVGKLHLEETNWNWKIPIPEGVWQDQDGAWYRDLYSVIPDPDQFYTIVNEIVYSPLTTREQKRFQLEKLGPQFIAFAVKESKIEADEKTVFILFDEIGELNPELQGAIGEWCKEETDELIAAVISQHEQMTQKYASTPELRKTVDEAVKEKSLKELLNEVK